MTTSTIVEEINQKRRRFLGTGYEYRGRNFAIVPHIYRVARRSSLPRARPTLRFYEDMLMAVPSAPTTTSWRAELQRHPCANLESVKRRRTVC
jgi:hypothetical protein